MMAIYNPHVVIIIVFSDVFTSGIRTKQSIEHPRWIRNNHVFVATLYIHLNMKQTWNQRKKNGSMSSFCLKPFPSKVTQVYRNVSLVAFWALLMDHGVWFFDSWTAEVCCERRNKPGIQQPKRWIQQPRFFNNQKIKGQQPKKKRFQQPTDSVCWLVELDLDCKLRIIMTWG